VQGRGAVGAAFAGHPEVAKVSLTGASTERVDTRVLQVIYSLQRPENPPLYVGQQVDLFIEAPER